MENNKISITLDEGIREIEIAAKKIVLPLLADNCRKTCQEAGWPEQMVTALILDILAKQVVEKLGLSPKRIQKGVAHGSQAPRILNALRTTAVGTTKKSRRETSA